MDRTGGGIDADGLADYLCQPGNAYALAQVRAPQVAQDMAERMKEAGIGDEFIARALREAGFGEHLALRDRQAV